MEKIEKIKMAEAENKKIELEKIVSKEDHSQNKSKQTYDNQNIKLKLREITSAHLEVLREFWEEIEWNHYVYGAKETDFLQLPVINTYLSEWKDEVYFDEAIIFKKCHTCLKIIETLNFAIAVHVHTAPKQPSLWKEGIKNLRESILQKLDYLSFMLLKNGEKYINPKTENIEYGAKDSEDQCLITLCLWGNLYAAVRKQGMSKFDFSFKLPMDIVRENCAVRIMHLPFNDDLNGKLKNEKYFQGEKFLSIKNEELLQTKKGPHISEEESQLLQSQEISDTHFTPFDPSSMPPLVEPEIQIVDPDEYFIVGGTFHFGLYAMPQLNVRSNNITYIHREKPQLQRIRYKMKIVPPRIIGSDPQYAVAEYETKRFQHELENAIVVQFQLPIKVMYLSTPEPARLFQDKRGYSKDCIFCPDYDKDFRLISFKTNQFGKFGMLQKKYENFPYKQWSLTVNDGVVLSLCGSKLNIDIQISNHGYTVKHLHPDVDLVSAEIDSTWMVADLLLQKLFEVGINIVLCNSAYKFTDISMKEKDLEENVYDCMALLCSNYSFMSVSNNSSMADEIILEYSTRKNNDAKRVIITSRGVIDYDAEQKRLEKVEAYLKKVTDIETNHSNLENLESEEHISEKKKAVEEADISQEIKETPVFCDLCDYVFQEIGETQKQILMNGNASLIQNVRTLLKLCRPISSL